MRELVVALVLAATPLLACVKPSSPSPPPPGSRVGQPTLVPVPPTLRPVVAPAPVVVAPRTAAAPATPPLVTIAIDLPGRGTYVVLHDRGDGHAPDGTPDAIRVRALGGDDALPERRVRVYGGAHGFCDAVLGAQVELTGRDGDENEVLHRALAAHVPGCTIRETSVAVLDPPAASTQLVPLAEGETGLGAAGVLDAAKTSAAHVAHVSESAHWATASVWRAGETIYAIVAGPACGDDDTCPGDLAVAVARSRPDGPPEVVIARPAHFPWEQPVDASFGFGPVVDVDGDGTVELVENAGSDSGFMLRLVRAGAQLPGDFVWRVQAEAGGGPLALVSAPRALAAPSVSP